ncbi:MAG: hypothetical protein MK160_12075 [Rhodobacteraceae bacterium]|nr:hypothetical protein [Paracoccaceae bacterium]
MSDIYRLGREVAGELPRLDAMPMVCRGQASGGWVMIEDLSDCWRPCAKSVSVYRYLRKPMSATISTLQQRPEPLRCHDVLPDRPFQARVKAVEDVLRAENVAGSRFHRGSMKDADAVDDGMNSIADLVQPSYVHKAVLHERFRRMRPMLHPSDDLISKHLQKPDRTTNGFRRLAIVANALLKALRRTKMREVNMMCRELEIA